MIALILDAILLAVPAEAVAFAVVHARTGRGFPPRVVIPNLAAGFCLVLAARLVAGHAVPLAPAAALGAALVAHVADLAVRWRSPQAAG